MRMIRLGAILAAVALWLAAPAFAETTRASQILERFEHANQWRDHVMIVAHRGGWMEKGMIVHPENSFEGIASAIELGVEMVEIDVRRSKDGEYVVMHDSWLDRTTDCRGEVVQRTVAELKQCRLAVEGNGRVTDERVPTLREMLAFTRGKVLVNIDNKLEIEDLTGMVAVARDLGMAEEVVIKQNLWSAEKIAEMKRTVAAIGEGVKFMPIIADDAVKDVRFLETASRAFSADAVEMINWHQAGEAMTDTGGALFTTRARAVAARGDWHLWVNTYSIVNKAGGYLSGGRGDKLAVLADAPGEAFGFWVDRGVTVIQTDEPKAAIDWLTANGYRIPYDLTN
ncbi:glycerophosphoryl diester phosphodiesterase [Mesorhizobium albiziae]|uniref:Glycerophosphoryl diester phosphodiesterase n=1 Tax=Neomesorhizobium albiziae TaxID=335020 RepID=A0A1I3YMT3_9HYPH|nr:glycerophosphodiester phosphodiesterase family protein [Mesorhizobium albiziae]GLS33394.1 glycerophosphoryl diester phosphodiesterase [Mesorhizobium albiziae]SFK33247.1 glycerophosphoryl diester phosphodiesterase [Mesorhizobium albiziae]